MWCGRRGVCRAPSVLCVVGPWGRRSPFAPLLDPGGPLAATGQPHLWSQGGDLASQGLRAAAQAPSPAKGLGWALRPPRASVSSPAEWAGRPRFMEL